MEQKKKILLIEDDTFMIELLARDLEAAGFIVSVAKTGTEGVQKFGEVGPDLILLDLLLPDLGGFEALRQIRRHPSGPQTKVMILSNIAEGPDMEEAKRLGVLEYLVKANYTLPEIVGKVQEVFSRA